MRPIHRDALERWIEIPAPEKLDESHPPGALDLPVGQQDFGRDPVADRGKCS